MKLCWALSPFLLLDRMSTTLAEEEIRATPEPYPTIREPDPTRLPPSSNGTLCGVRFPLIIDTVSFIEAIDGASTDPTSSSRLCVDVNATLDLDAVGGGGVVVPSIGLNLTDRYFDATCIGYDDTHKCTLQRSKSLGRFFFGSEPFEVGFDGFSFENGRRAHEFEAGNIDTEDEHGVSGGAFLISGTNSIRTNSLAFFKCAFLNNTSDGDGGAIAIATESSSDWNVIVSYCDFHSNHAYFYGGGLSVLASGTGEINVIVRGCNFMDNVADSVPESDDIDIAYNIDFTCDSTDADAVVVSDANDNPTGNTCLEPSAAPSPSPSAEEVIQVFEPEQCKGEQEMLLTDTASFLEAIENASNDPASPSTICVKELAMLDLDEPGFVGVPVPSFGLDLTNKYFDAYCASYTSGEAGKCTLTRSQSTGRFFSGETPVGIAFTGFRFQNGSTESQSAGGAFQFLPIGKGVGDVAFTNCEFVNNTATYRGGAVSVEAGSRQEWKVSVHGCTFESNTADAFFGGGIFAIARHRGEISLGIDQSVFSDNAAPFGGGDIYASGLSDFSCTDTDADSVNSRGMGTCTPP